MLPFGINLAGAALAYGVARGAALVRYTKAAPSWLFRLLVTFAFAYGTVACVLAIVPKNIWWGRQPEAHLNPGVLLTFAIVCGVVGFFTLRQKRDVFPLALIAAAAIVISTAFIIRRFVFGDFGGTFLIAVWLIGTSTTAGFVLMRYVRAWHAHELPTEGAHA
jgi:hypothetical protein